MKKILIAGLALILAGCASAMKTYLSDGSEGYTIDCSTQYNSWGGCFEKAGSICASRGYEIKEKIEKPQMYGNGTITYERTLLVSCKNPSTNVSHTPSPEQSN